MMFSQIKLLLRIVTPVLVLIGWIYFSSDYKNPIVLRKSTMQVIKSNDQLIQTYVRKYGEAPPSLNELRFFAKVKGKFYQGFDAWGERLEYLPLGKINYTMRSFGEDGEQNTESSDSDPGVFRWGQMVSRGLQYSFDLAENVMRPAVVLFAGSDDRERKWNAKLFLDQATGARRLLVRSKSLARLFMLAPHDSVEEFLWLPSGERIVFTASGSNRYGDGVWIWDLKTDHIWNILELGENSGGYKPTSQARSLHVALGYVSNESYPKIGVYIAPADVRPLNPKWFFSKKNLQVFEVGDGENARLLSESEITSSNLNSHATFDYSWLTSSTVESGGVGSNLQKEWLNLPRNGNWESAMHKWQDYAAQYPQSPLAAYAVWALSMFYRDAYTAHQNSNSKDAEILRSFSDELGDALSKMPSAPGWMRAVGPETGE